MAHAVQVANSLPTGVEGVELPNKITYPPGAHVILTDEQYAQLNPAMFTNNLLIDGGVVGGAGDQVTTQGAAVTLTSAQVATANATDLASAEALANALKTAYNALQVDVAALNAALSGAGKSLA
jgi:acetyl-CoA acetyltransferase